MSRAITIDTTSIEMWKHLLSLKIEGVTADRIILLSEGSNVRLMVAFASGVAINLFSSALYDAIKQFHPNEATINGKQIPTNQVQIGVLINSQVHVQQSGPKAECEKNQGNGSHNTTP